MRLTGEYLQLAQAMNSCGQLHDALALHFPTGNAKNTKALRKLFEKILPAAGFKVSMTVLPSSA